MLVSYRPIQQSTLWKPSRLKVNFLRAGVKFVGKMLGDLGGAFSVPTFRIVRSNRIRLGIDEEARLRHASRFFAV